MSEIPGQSTTKESIMLHERQKRLAKWCELIHAPSWLYRDLSEPKHVYRMKIRPIPDRADFHLKRDEKLF
ncbi:MAG: hypothetical protein G01um101470_1087, partial [Parcubacteria group bacterium Gr01-1014_70]